ncbi:uncharacterized protein LOC136041592 isoform X2 [Artemia franciscana]|uniref:uncharacterized protein LOC136041592 isoform X2 n=1 Tax=Artemia franciscana TaxID=6661 RepID=UPI0032DBAAF4
MLLLRLRCLYCILLVLLLTEDSTQAEGAKDVGSLLTKDHEKGKEPQRFGYQLAHLVPLPLASPSKYTVKTVPEGLVSNEYLAEYTFFIDSMLRVLFKSQKDIERAFYYLRIGSSLFGLILWVFLGWKAAVMPALWLQGALGGPLLLFKRSLSEQHQESVTSAPYRISSLSEQLQESVTSLEGIRKIISLKSDQSFMNETLYRTL